MSARDDARHDRMRQARKERARRRRRRRRLVRIVLVVLSLAVLAVSVPYIVKNVIGGTVFLDAQGNPPGKPVPEETEEPAAPVGETEDTVSESSPAGNEPFAGQEEVPETEAAEGEEAPAAGTEEAAAEPQSSALKEWTYTSSAVLPDGDIVDMHADGYSYERMRRDLYLLQQKYPASLHVYNFGTTLDNREMLDAVVGSPDAGRDVIIQYSMHAREHIVTNLAMKQLEELLKAMETGQYDGVSYADIFSRVRLHIIPMMNPDGVMISQGGIDAIENPDLHSGLLAVFESDKVLGKASPDIKEYATTWKANARSVDLNRNFDTPGWTTEMGTQQPSCSRYPGTAPNSEPEVQALIALTDSINCVAQLAYHCHGRLIYWDYGMGASDPDLYERDRQFAQLVSDLTTTPELPGYTMISTVDDGQNPGGCSDYFMQVRHIPSLTVEVGKKFKADGSYNDAPLSVDQIDDIYAENALILPAVAKMFAG